MTKKRNTKRALLASVLSMIMCVTMLIGSTFAWFTDTDTTAVNKIVAGNLDIEIVDKDGSPLDSMSFVNRDGSAEILWEPGATFRTIPFQILNNGKLALKFKVEINNTEVSYNKLNEVIDFYLIDGNGNKINLSDMQDIELLPTSKYVDKGLMYIEGHMDEYAGNDYMNQTLEGVAITVYATQSTEETDSFNDQYDKDAEYDDDVITVTTAEEFIAAFTKLEDGGIVALANDIDMTGKEWTPVNNKSFTLRGNGKKITGLNGGMADHTGAKVIEISNVTFDEMIDNSTTNYAGLIGDADTAEAITLKKVTINAANISSAEWVGGFIAFGDGYNNNNNGPVYCVITMEDCTITNSILKSEGDGSTGCAMGQCGGNPATKTYISNFEASGNNLSQTTSRTDKLGTILGSVNEGDYTEITYDINRVQEGKPVGRFVSSNANAKLIINGNEIAIFDGK